MDVLNETTVIAMPVQPEPLSEDGYWQLIDTPRMREFALPGDSSVIAITVCGHSTTDGLSQWVPALVSGFARCQGCGEIRQWMRR